MSLKEKYFRRDGPIAFRLWMYAVVIEELEKNPNKPKAISVRERIIEFSESAWVTTRGTTEERADIQKMIDNLTYIGADC